MTTHSTDSILPTNDQSICKIGIISDVQYADIDDRYNFNKTRIRFYRKALALLRRAVNGWTEDGVDCVLQLGDLIDGFNKDGNASKSALSAVLDVFKLFPGPVFHTWGNHELYNFTQEELLKSPLFNGNMDHCTCPEGKAYYSFKIHQKVKVLVLNCFEISMLGLPKESQEYREAEMLLREKNPNEELNSPQALQGTDRRFLQFNGGVSLSQLRWLEDNLKDALEQEENIIIMGHISIEEQSADSMCLCYNYEDVLQVLSTYSDCVVCYFAGHDHEGGSSVDASGILHVTFPGTVESCEPDAYATAYVYNDRIVIKGKGSYSKSSHEAKLRFPIA